MRTILIGDIHGCYDEFIALLKKSKFNKDKDRLIEFSQTINGKSIYFQNDRDLQFKLSCFQNM